MEFIARILGGIDDWFSRPLFEIGNVEINLSRLAVALLIVTAAWWLSSRLERAVRGLSAGGKKTRMLVNSALKPEAPRPFTVAVGGQRLPVM